MMKSANPSLRFFGKLALVAALAAAVVSHNTAPSAAQKIKGITIGSGSVGADFFVLGTSLQQVLSKKFPDARIENSATSGSVENFRLLRRGDVDVGIYTTTAVTTAWDAKGAFANEKPYKEIRTLAGVFPFTYHLISLADSRIVGMADLKSKRVGIGPDPATLIPLYSPFFEASGINMQKDIVPIYASYADIYRMLGEGQIDAVVGFTSGSKVPASIQELASAKDIRWISFEAGALEKAGLKPIMFQAGTLPDQPEKVIGVATGFVALGATEQLPDDVAYAFVKSLHENLKEISTLQPALGQAVRDPSTLTSNTDPFPYHPGAIRYWKEVGLWPK